MDYFAAEFVTSTISVDPPGGTGHPSPPNLPLPTLSTIPTAFHYLHATRTGHVALWVFMAFFTAGLLGVAVMAARVERRARVFHALSAVVLLLAMVTYFAQATGFGITHPDNHWPVGHGRTSHHHHHHHQGPTDIYFREVFWIRNVDWLISTLLNVTMLALLAGLSPLATSFALVADVVMIVATYVVTVNPGHVKGHASARWLVWLIFGCLWFLVLFGTLLTSGASAAKLRTRKTRGVFFLLVLLDFLLWSGYPVLFLLSSGLNKISVNAEIISFGILDVSSGLGFIYFLLLVHVHGEDDSWTFPDWFTEHRVGLGTDGRGGYGAVAGTE